MRLPRVLALALAALLATAFAAQAQTIANTDQTNHKVFQRSAGTTAKTVSFAGTYSGAVPATVEIEIVPAAGGAPAVGFTTLSSATIAGGAWSGTLSVPQGGWYQFVSRSKNGGGTVLATSTQTTNQWGVGLVIAVIGQSNAQNMFNTSVSPPTSDSLTVYTDVFGNWQFPVVGNGAITLANLVRTGIGSIPVALMDSGIGGSGLDPASATQAGGNGYWLDLTAAQPYTKFISALTFVGGDCEIVIWDQGETDALSHAVSQAAYFADLGTLQGRLLAQTGRTAAQMPFITALIGRLTPHDAATDPFWTGVKNAQQEFGQTATGAFPGADFTDGVMVDTFHYDAATYARMAHRYAQSVLKALSLAATSGGGPKISGVTGTIGSAVLGVAISLNGGTQLLDGSGGSSGVSLTGWEVSKTAFASTIAINSTAFSGGGVTLTLNTALQGGDVMQVRYLYGDAPTISNIAYDNSNPQGDSIGVPLLPSDGVVAVTTPAGAGGFPLLLH